MPELDAHKINPPSVYAGEESIDCPECDERIEAIEGCCPFCGAAIDADTIRDRLEDQRTPPEWT